MRVAIIGSAGFIGRWVRRALLDNGHEVTGIDIREPPPDERGDFVFCDILDAQGLKASLLNIKPDAVVHLAARVDLDEKSDLRNYAANIDGVRNVVTAANASPSIKRVIYTSSQLVCRVGYVPESPDDYCPDTLYGKSKVLTEQIVREAAHRDGMEWCLVRPTTVWGPGMNRHYQHMLKLIKRGRIFHCGPEKLLKSYGYVGNVAFQYMRLLSVPPGYIGGRTLYLADYEPLSLREYIDALAIKMRGKRIPTLPSKVAQGLAYVGDFIGAVRGREFSFNTFRLRNIRTEYLFDLSPTRDICGDLPFTKADGIEATVRWFETIKPS